MCNVFNFDSAIYTKKKIKKKLCFTWTTSFCFTVCYFISIFYKQTKKYNALNNSRERQLQHRAYTQNVCITSQVKEEGNKIATTTTEHINSTREERSPLQVSNHVGIILLYVFKWWVYIFSRLTLCEWV